MQTQTLPKTALEAYQKIKENAGKRMQTIRNCSAVLRAIRQGDVYLFRVDALENRGAETKNRQLVPGVSNGSRHIVADNPHVRIFKTNPEKMIARLEKKTGIRILPVQIGPGIEAETEWTLTHPSHPFCTKIPAGGWQVVYQIDPVTRERAKD